MSHKFWLYLENKFSNSLNYSAFLWSGKYCVFMILMHRYSCCSTDWSATSNPGNLFLLQIDYLQFQFKIWVLIFECQEIHEIKVYSVPGWAAQTTGNLTTCRRYDRDTQTSQTLQNWSWGTDTSEKSRSFKIWEPHPLRVDSSSDIRLLEQRNSWIWCQMESRLNHLGSKDLISKKLPNSWIDASCSPLNWPFFF